MPILSGVKRNWSKKIYCHFLMTFGNIERKKAYVSRNCADSNLELYVQLSSEQSGSITIRLPHNPKQLSDRGLPTFSSTFVCLNASVILSQYCLRHVSLLMACKFNLYFFYYCSASGKNRSATLFQSVGSASIFEVKKIA